MLVLTRKLMQHIVVGDNIRVTVLKIKGNTVRLGIDAPSSVSILRGELTGSAELGEQPGEAADGEPSGRVALVLDEQLDPQAGEPPLRSRVRSRRPVRLPGSPAAEPAECASLQAAACSMPLGD